MHGFYTEINANNKQVTDFLKHAGTARHAWNWALNLCIEKMQKGEKIPSAIDLHKLLVSDVKKENPWYYEVSKCAPQQALRDLESAFKKFFTGRKKNSSKHFKEKYHRKFIRQYAKKELDKLCVWHEKGFPQFKKKGVKDSFYLEGSIQAEWNMIKVPKIGNLKLYEKLPFGEYKNCVISRRGDSWFISFKNDFKKEIDTNNRKGKVGVDVGVKTLATLSDETTFTSPKLYKTLKTKLARLQRKQSRQFEACKDKKDNDGHIIYGSNYNKTKLKISKLHLKISDTRKDAIHKLTSYLVKNHDEITIEDLNVIGLMKNHKLSAAIADGGFYEFKRQLKYKCEWYVCKLNIADRFFASSKTCSKCNHKKEHLTLKQRTFNCEKCGFSCDRDLNAAINLKNYNAVSFTVKACGDSKLQSDKDSGNRNPEKDRNRNKTANVKVCVSS